MVPLVLLVLLLTWVLWAPLVLLSRGYSSPLAITIILFPLLLFYSFDELIILVIIKTDFN